MKKLLVFFLLVASACMAQPAQKLMYLNATGQWVTVSEAAPLPTAFTSVGTVTTSIVLPTGLLGSATLSIPLASAVALPTAPTGATRCLVMPTQDVNWGNTTVSSGTGQQYFFQDIPGQGFLGFQSFTSFRLIGRTAVATATILWY